MQPRDKILVDTVTNLIRSSDDADRWVQLYTHLWPFVLAMTSQYLKGDQFVAEDLSQVVFMRILKVFRERGFVLPPASQGISGQANAFRSFVKKICHSVVIDNLR